MLQQSILGNIPFIQLYFLEKIYFKLTNIGQFNSSCKGMSSSIHFFFHYYIRNKIMLLK